MATPAQTLYLGYGSNLWLAQMRARCPSSAYLGVGRLASYKWIINARGYANVVPSSIEKDVVYGLVYGLTSADEGALDRNEGVPGIYSKEVMQVEFWESEERGKSKVDVSKLGAMKDMLVYVDPSRVEEGEPKEEYVYRINEGVRDAKGKGVPEEYVRNVIRRFIPEMGEGDEYVVAMAERQAKSFEDE